MDLSNSAFILIIDDQSINLKLMTILLETEGYNVGVANNGEEGIKKVEQLLPDLILLDILMPGIDGFETCRRLKASNKTKNIPIIFMSALHKIKDKIQGFELGAVDYITKPFDDQEVFARINTQIKLSKLNQELINKNQLLLKEIEERKQVESQLLQSKKRLKTIINTNVNGIVLIDEEGKILFINPAAEKLFSRRAKNMKGETFGIPFTTGELTQINIPNPNGNLLTAEMRVVNILWENKPAYLVSLVDISDRQKMEEKLNILFQATEQSPASIVITDSQGNIQYVNPKFEEISGYREEELLGKNPRLLKSGYTSNEEYKKMWETLTKGKEWHGEFQNIKKNGDFYWEKASISPIINNQGKTTHFVAVKEDITTKKYQEDMLQYQAHYDCLTDIPNRNFALKELDSYIYKAEKNGENLGLMFLDLDHFKDVNDSLGHDFGDELLKQTANRIKNILRETDLVARLGGDEFLIVIPYVSNKIALQIIANKIVNCLQKTFNLDANEVLVSASVGVTIYPEDGKTAKDLMRNADTAMLSAKRNGRNNYQFFTSTMNQAVLRKLQLQKNLTHALEKQEFKLVYQPIIDLKSHTVVSAEVLMRWENEELGLVTPNQFIPIAEETGLIIDIGEWLLSSACKEAASWQNNYNLSIAINISPRQFKDHNLLKFISQALKSSQLKPHFLELEITEKLLLEDSPYIDDILREINNLDISFSLDDFGTGYSSLSYLMKFPFKTLKIDQSFIADIVNNERVKILVKTIIGMAKSLNLKVIAEGIENQAQFSLLKSLDCDYGQGYFFSKPLCSNHFSQYLLDNSYQLLAV